MDSQKQLIKAKCGGLRGDRHIQTKALEPQEVRDQYCPQADVPANEINVSLGGINDLLPRETY